MSSKAPSGFYSALGSTCPTYSFFNSAKRSGLRAVNLHLGFGRLFRNHSKLGIHRELGHNSYPFGSSSEHRLGFTSLPSALITLLISNAVRMYANTMSRFALAKCIPGQRLPVMRCQFVYVGVLVETCLRPNPNGTSCGTAGSRNRSGLKTSGSG